MSVAIVTGASRGLGEALATGLARTGWSLVVDGRDPVTLDAAAVRIRAAAAPGTRVVTVVGDIIEEKHRHDLTAAAFALGRLDLVVNNAGTLGTSPLPSLADYPLDDLRVAFEVNVVAPLGVLQSALPLLLDAPHPRLLNVTSDAAVEAYEGWGGYGSSKAALDQLHQVLATELRDVRVYTFDPGDMRTEMHQAAFPGEDISDRPDPSTVVPAFRSLLATATPSGRVRASDWTSR